MQSSKIPRGKARPWRRVISKFAFQNSRQRETQSVGRTGSWERQCRSTHPISHRYLRVDAVRCASETCDIMLLVRNHNVLCTTLVYSYSRTREWRTRGRGTCPAALVLRTLTDGNYSQRDKARGCSNTALYCAVLYCIVCETSRFLSVAAPTRGGHGNIILDLKRVRRMFDASSRGCTEVRK